MGKDHKRFTASSCGRRPQRAACVPSTVSPSPPPPQENRLKWRSNQPITVLELRAYRLPAPLLLPPRDDFFGCFSWVDVATGQQPEVRCVAWAASGRWRLKGAASVAVQSSACIVSARHPRWRPTTLPPSLVAFRSTQQRSRRRRRAACRR